MPTKYPRLQIALTPEARAAVEGLCQATGISASSFIGGLVHDAIPMIHATTQAVLQARRSPNKAADTLGQALSQAMYNVTQAKLDLDDKQARRKRLHKRPVRRGA